MCLQKCLENPEGLCSPKRFFTDENASHSSKKAQLGALWSHSVISALVDIILNICRSVNLPVAST